jgi:hypothetical protein
VLKGSKIYCVSFGGFFYFNFLIIVVMKLALAHKFF